MVSEFSPIGVMFAWYKMLLLRHFYGRGHCDVLMQLQVLLPIDGDGYKRAVDDMLLLSAVKDIVEDILLNSKMFSAK